MNRQQLNQIKEIGDMLNKGQTHPIKITQAFLIIQPDANEDTAMRVKINTINRFMMLSFRDEWDAMTGKEAVDAILPPLDLGSIGTMENKDKQSHKEEPFDIQDIQGFLTKAEKNSLKEESSNTVLEKVVDGKVKRTRKKRK